MTDTLSEVPHDVMARIRALLKRRDSLDVSGMRDEQISRRIARFAQRARIVPDFEMVHRLKVDELFRAKLVDALTINVTSVFRNPDMWKNLIDQHLSRLGVSLHAWSAGCSSGAEAYSLAIATKIAGVRLKVLATDIDLRILERARTGVFNADETQGTPPEILERFFTRDDRTWRVNTDLKRTVEFAKHDLLADPVLSSGPFDLVLCRNVVIYFAAKARDDLHARMAGALRPGGVLFVGGAERVHYPATMGLALDQPCIYVKEAAEAVA